VLNSPTNNNVLGYNSGLSKWQNQNLSTAYASVIGVPAGSTAAQINAAIAGAPDDSVVRLYGTYALSSPIVVTSHLDAAAATINYTGTGVAIQVGAGGAGVLMLAKSVRLPQVVNLSKTNNGWAQVAGSVGVQVINANACQIVVPYVTNFETALEMRGVSAGNVFNTVTLGNLENCMIGQHFTADSSGWVNQNTFIGGQISMYSNEGTRVAGTRYILMDNVPNPINTNTWLGTSLEGDGTEYCIECNGGVYNLWIGCRFESTLGARVYWNGTATHNAIRDGYAEPIIVSAAGAYLNDVSQAGRSRNIDVSSTSGVFNLQNSSSATYPALTVMDPNVDFESGNDPATMYALAATAIGWKGKRPADTFDRVIIDTVNATVKLGNGTVAPTIYLGVGEPVRVAALATGSRPSASSGGVGAMMFDTTLGKPIWSNGTVWKDATGATV
jgi:hypothetical protein